MFIWTGIETIKIKTESAQFVSSFANELRKKINFISDFTEKLDDVSEAVEQATFLSIDGEFTGDVNQKSVD